MDRHRADAGSLLVAGHKLHDEIVQRVVPLRNAAEGKVEEDFTNAVCCRWRVGERPYSSTRNR
jgi:hypothetical protein